MCYYIAYGSNLNKKQMVFRCPDSRPVGTAELRDWRLVFRGSKSGSYLTIEPKEGSVVPVAVWHVSDRDIASLDRYEGFPTFYYKRTFDLEVKSLATGKPVKVKAFVYIMDDRRPYGIPTSYYMATCAQGYRDFGFDIDVLLKARQNTEIAYRAERRRNGQNTKRSDLP